MAFTTFVGQILWGVLAGWLRLRVFQRLSQLLTGAGAMWRPIWGLTIHVVGWSGSLASRHVSISEKLFESRSAKNMIASKPEVLWNFLESPFVLGFWSSAYLYCRGRCEKNLEVILHETGRITSMSRFSDIKVNGILFVNFWVLSQGHLHDNPMRWIL